ncbi:MAG: hypothetical protein ACFFD2_04915 [Promethearchaeota archaeon]
MKKYRIIFLIFLTCLLLPLLFSNTNYDKLSDFVVDPSLNSNPINTNTYSTITPALNVTEYANRTDAGQTMTLLYNTTSNSTTNASAYAVLPPNWQGNQIDVNLYNIYENRCWSLNSKFNGYFTGSQSFARVFEYGNGYLGGIRSENGLDKILYMAFTFGKITNATNEYNATEIQDEILNRTLNWMDVNKTDAIIIIDDDNYAPINYYQFYVDSLTRLGYTDITVQTASSGLDDAKLVIRCCGDDWTLGNHQNNIENYLDQVSGAQNLIVSGQDVGYDLNGDPFYTDYLHAEYLKDDAESNVTHGFDGGIIGDQLTFFINGTGSTFWPDVIKKVLFNNSECLLNNWSLYEYGNQYAEDWYYRNEPQGDSGALFLLIEDSGDNSYDGGDKVWAEQEIYIDRSDILWAGLSLDYWGYNDWGEYSGSFKLYVTINDTEVYSKSIADIVPFLQWRNSGMIPISISNLPLPGPINIKIGLEVTYSVNYDPDIKPMIMVDNFKLYIKSRVPPDTLNLEMDGLTVTGGSGYGNCTLIPTNPWTLTPVQVNFTWYPTPTPINNEDFTVTFMCDTILFASKVGQTLYTADPSKTGLLLQTDQGTNISWSFQYYVNLPTGYWNHSLVISQPADWTFTFVSEPQLPAVNRLSNCTLGSITVPTTNITISPDGYWRFQAYSPNYLNKIHPQIYNGSHWINSTNLMVTNLTRIICQIYNGTGFPPNLDSSSINLTIFNPNNQLWYSNITPIFVNGWAIFPNLTIFGLNTTGGHYDVQISWNNGLEAGYMESNFTIIHNTEMVISKPSDAVTDQTTEVNYGELLLIRVGLNDTDRNELTKGVDVTLNWTEEGSPIQKNLTDLETGQYEIVLDTSDLPSIDNYTILINSSSPYFTDALYTLDLAVTSETLLSSPQYPKIISEWNQNITIQVNYLNAFDESGINDSTIMVNWTLGPYSVTQIGNGQYDIEINLSYAEIMEYTLEINATKPNCAFKILKIKLEVKAINTGLTSESYPRVISEWSDNITIEIDYHTLDSQGINSSQIIVNWTQNYYTILEIGSGIYQIEMNTSWCSVQEYLLEINASKVYHQNKTLQIIIDISGVETLLTSPQYPKIITTWGENITIQIDYLRAIDEQGLNSSTISVNWSIGPYSIYEGGNGRYTIEFNLSYAEILEYTVEINATKSNHILKTLKIKIEVKPIETDLVSADYPRVIGEWGNNITISINFRTAANSIGINNSVITMNWTPNYYSISEIGNGIYQIELNTSCYVIQEYILEINALKAYHYNKTIQIIVEINAIATELISDEYPRVIEEWNTNITININYRKLNLQGINNSVISINWTQNCYTISEIGNGLYQIELNTSQYSIQEYILEINASKLYHKNKTLRITVVINTIETELISDNYPRVIGEWNINHTIQIEYRTINGYQGIPNSLISVNWTPNYYTIYEIGSGVYEIELNTSCCIIQTYYLEINASKRFHENQTLIIIVEIDVTEAELISSDYPRVIGEWGNNITIEITYRAISDLQGIPASTVSINWSQNYYSITEIASGIYQIELNTSQCNLQEYILEINASKLYYQNRTLRITVEIVAIATELISDEYPRVIEEWNTNITITINYRTVNPHGINNSIISINWTQNYYTITEIGNGFYQIELNTSQYTLQEYLLEINVSKIHHANKTLHITIEINEIATELISDDYPRVIGEWNINHTIQIEYRTINGYQGIPDSIISVNWTSNYYTITNLGSGIYEIELNTSCYIIQTYYLEINASKRFHENQTLHIIVEIDTTEAELISPDYPRVIGEWGNNITIEITYRAVSDLQGIPASTISINWSQNYYSITEIASGIYQIELNTSQCNIREYILEINASKLYYQNRTLRITVKIDAIATELISDEYPRVIKEWNINITIIINYHTINLQGINNSVIAINWTQNYYIITEIGNGLYQIELNTSQCTLQEYILEINASKTYHENKTLRITLEIDAIATELISDDYPRVIEEWNTNITITINYHTINLQGINDSVIAINWTQNYYIITEIGNGLYQIELNTSQCALQEYILEINASKTYHENKTLRITLEIDAIATELISDDYPRVIEEWNTNITITINYHTINLQGINDSVIAINWTQNYYIITEIGNGLYQIELNTSQCALQEYILEINASKTYHENRKLRITLEIDAIATELISDEYPRVIGEWNINHTIQIEYRTINGYQGIPNSLISVNWTPNFYTITNVGNGIYEIELNTSCCIIQPYYLEINASKRFYENQTLHIIVEIDTTEAELISPDYPRVIGEWGSNITIEITYRAVSDLHGIPASIISTNWSQDHCSISEIASGIYQIELNTSQCTLKDYILEINASKLYYQNRSLRITVVINAIATELISDDYPRVIEEWNTNITITINYRTINPHGINNSIVLINWTQNYYTITEIGNGFYQIELNTSQYTLQEYLLEINTSKVYHENKSLHITIEINAIETKLISDNYPRVVGEWNINVTIGLEFKTAIGSRGILNSIISINWTTNYYITEIGNGEYEIELNSSWCTIQEYVLEINTSKIYHQNKTLRITINILAAETDLISDSYPRVIGERGFNITIEVNFRLAINLDGINNSIITVNWILGYYKITEIGNGIYQIELNTSWCNIQEYTLQINASKIYHYSKSISIAIEIRAVETELTSNNYPRVVSEWNKNITIKVNFHASIYGIGIEEALITTNWTNIYYTLSKLANGIYQIELNTSWCNIQEYIIEINASKIYHYNKSIRITIQINVIETKLSYQPITTVPYGQNATIHLKYTDLAGNPVIPELDGSDILSVNKTYWVSYNPLNEYAYTLKIATVGLQLTDLLNITAFKSNFKIQTVFIVLTYRPIFTSLTNLNESLITLPVEESIFIMLIYNDTENDVGIENASLSFYGYDNISFSEIGYGYYQVMINAENMTESYTILATINQTGFLDKSVQFIIQIKEWSEFTNISFSSDVETTPVGGLAYFSVLLIDEFSSTYFNDSDIDVEYTWKFRSGNLTYNGNGNYSLNIDTSDIPPGTYTIIINATTKDGHLLFSEAVTLVVTRGSVSWFMKYSWLFGIAGAVIAIVAGYTIRNKWKQRDWEKKVKHIYVLNKAGIPLYDKRLGGVSSADASLVTSALIGISTIVQEIVQSKRELKTIDHMDNKILFHHGISVIVAVLSSVDFPIIRRKLAQFTNRFEYHFQKELETWKGNVDVFFGTNKLINEFFPIEEYIKDEEISAEWFIERLFEMYGLSGITTLLMVELGLKDPGKIAAGVGIKEKQVSIILRTFQDLLLIDSETKLTKKGQKAIEIYRKRKEKYINILKIMKRKEENDFS